MRPLLTFAAAAAAACGDPPSAPPADPTGLRVTTNTTGVDLDPNGYRVRVRADGAAADTTASLRANGTRSISTPPGSYIVTLEDEAVNCDQENPGPRAVTVPSAGTAAVVFSVACTPAAQLAVTLDGDIYLVKANGANRSRLTTTGLDGDPAWSPDGSKIAFTSARDGNEEIYVMNPDGSGGLRLTNDEAADDQPAWSPDATRLVFSRHRCELEQCSAELLVMNANGSGAIRLASEFGSDAAWSADGRWIAFVATSYVPGVVCGGWEDPPCAMVLMAVQADGSRLTVVTKDALQPTWRPRLAGGGGWDYTATPSRAGQPSAPRP